MYDFFVSDKKNNIKKRLLVEVDCAHSRTRRNHACDPRARARRAAVVVIAYRSCMHAAAAQPPRSTLRPL
jgi:hypothetical protein